MFYLYDNVKRMVASYSYDDIRKTGLLEAKRQCGYGKLCLQHPQLAE